MAGGHGGQMGAMPGMGKAGPVVARHGPGHGPGNTAVATVQRNRLGEPGTGLENVDHRVLAYNDLRSVKPFYDQRPSGREIELHLTGNMEQYMWSFDGEKFSAVNGPIPFQYGERLRLTLVTTPRWSTRSTCTACVCVTKSGVNSPPKLA